MPSGEIVEIDIAYNDVAILDASACALAAPNSSASSDRKEHGKVSQSQDDRSGGDDDEVQGEDEALEDNAEENRHHPPAVHQVSPVPRRKKSGTMTTPRPVAKVSSSRIAVATPGGEESARKDGNGRPKPMSSKKPSKTLHSFFAKAGPVKKKTTATSSASGGGIKALTAMGSPTSSSLPVAVTAAVVEKKKEGKMSSAKSSSGREPSAQEVAEKATAGTNEAEQKAVPAKTKKKLSSGKAKADEKAEDVVAQSASNMSSKTKPTKKSSSTSKIVEAPIEDLDGSPAHALAVASRAMKAGGRRRSRSRSYGRIVAAAESDVVVISLDDDSASVTVGEKNGVETVDVPSVVVDAASDEGEGSDIAPAVEEATDPMKDGNEADANEGKALDEAPAVDESCADEAADDVMEGSREKGKAHALSEKKSKGNGEDVTVTMEETAVEQSVGQNEGCTEEPTDVVANIDRAQCSDSIDENEKVLEDNGDDAVIVVDDAEKRSSGDNAKETTQPEQTNKASDDEVVVIDEAQELTSATTISKESAGPSSNPRKKPSAQPTNKKGSKKKASAAPSKKKAAVAPVKKKAKRPGNIAASLKKQVATCPAKKVETDSAETNVVASAESKDNEPVPTAEGSRIEQTSSIAASLEEGGAASLLASVSPGEEDAVVAHNAPEPRASAKEKPSKKKAPAPEKKKASAPEKKAKGTVSIAASLKKQADACPAKKGEAADAPTAEIEEVARVEPTSSTSEGSKSDGASFAASACSKEDGSAANEVSATNAPDLSEEDASRLRRYVTLRDKYVARAAELGERPSVDDFEEESPLAPEDGAGGSFPVLEEGSVEVGDDGEFPDALLTRLALIVQGSSLPLSVLAERTLAKLTPYISPEPRPLTVESISSKIKLLAQRKSYLSGPPPAAPSEKSAPAPKLDRFENAEECYMWRWELSSIDLLPQESATLVKKARALRKKLQGHHRAVLNLIAAIDKAVTWLQGASGTVKLKAEGDKLVAKASDAEEKVLKFEREHEKARLLKEAKLLKQKSKAAEEADKQREKERQEEEKLADKKRKDEEKARKKLEAAKEREEAKRKKNEEKEQERLEKLREAEEKESKRKARMMSFFSKGGGGAKKRQKVAALSCGGSVVPLKGAASGGAPSFDSDAFWNAIDSRDEHVSNPFAKLSKRSRESKRRKTKLVRVSVFVTVLSENAFAPQPYDEERVIIVPNRYKFLGFHEDVRPPYHGTWSKKSDVVTGRTPLGKDTKYLDYDIDSEAEWEEGDDEEGEDLKDEDDGADEEDDLQNEEDNDGWLAAEDDLGLEDEDEETRELRKKNLSSGSGCAASARPSHFKACVVAPCFGGLVHEGTGEKEMECVIEGFSAARDAMDVLSSHVGCVITPDVSICLDAFPPVEEANSTGKKEAGASGSSSQNKEMSPESQKVMAVFVHNSTQYKSKELLVTELLKAHPDVTNSRAQAMRELDVIAEKRRLANGGGVVWEVKADHLDSLGLQMNDLRSPPDESPPKASEDPNAPKRNVSSFILYSNANRNDVKVSNPEAGFGDIARILSKNFKSLTHEERAKWDEMAAVDKERYQKEMAEHSTKGMTPSSSDENDKTALSPAPSPPKQVEVDGQQAKKPSSTKNKRKKPAVSVAMAGLLASFLKKSKKQKTA